MPTPTERRIELQHKLEAVLGSNHVFYRPPESIKLTYPCIVYRLKNVVSRYADNNAYSYMRCYEVQLIHKTADTDLIEELLKTFSYIQFDGSFIFENLIHENFTLYY